MIATPARTLAAVPVAPLPLERFHAVLDEDGYDALLVLARHARELLTRRVVWCVNSTATGGGVSEMLRSLLADPIGVLQGFVAHVGERCEAHLVLAGPAAAGVAADPEGAAVLREVLDAWSALPEAARRRVHIASLPMEDAEENAAIVNALQRHADVVVQKSIAEGFGLTVAEALWKARPVVASAVGGTFLEHRHLRQWVELIERLPVATTVAPSARPEEQRA